MRVSRWGNSLAVRLPAALLRVLDLKEGDNVEIQSAGERSFQIRREMTREEAIAELQKVSWKAPPGYKFRREDAYER